MTNPNNTVTTTNDAAKAKPEMTGVKSEIASKRKMRKARQSDGKQRKKPKYQNLNIYIFKILKQVHPELGISMGAMLNVNSMLLDLLDKLGSSAAHMAKVNRRNTITCREVAAACSLLMTQNIAQHAKGEGAKAALLYEKANRSIVDAKKADVKIGA